MQVINWLALQPTEADINILREQIIAPIKTREFRQMLVEAILQTYPWQGRTDLIPCYHPRQFYLKDQWIALPVFDLQKIRPTTWQVAKVIRTQREENPHQAGFQILTLQIFGNKEPHLLTSDVRDAEYPTFELPLSESEDLSWLSAWIADTYAIPLQNTLQKLAQS
jgi:hypothetical protein